MFTGLVEHVGTIESIDLCDVGARPDSSLARPDQIGARIVTFVNGMVLREPIVTLDDEARRLVWTAEGGRARHYNAALQVSELADGLTSVVWTMDFLPDDASGFLSKAIEAGMAAMQRSLDALAA